MATTYTVKPGDSYFNLAKKWKDEFGINISPAKLLKLNNLNMTTAQGQAGWLKVGQKINVPQEVWSALSPSFTDSTPSEPGVYTPAPDEFSPPTDDTGNIISLPDWEPQPGGEKPDDTPPYEDGIPDDSPIFGDDTGEEFDREEFMKRFPEHWGEPPEIQTMDMTMWPGGYGNGSGTMRNWIMENMRNDNPNLTDADLWPTIGWDGNPVTDPSGNPVGEDGRPINDRFPPPDATPIDVDDPRDMSEFYPEELVPSGSVTDLAGDPAYQAFYGQYLLNVDDLNTLRGNQADALFGAMQRNFGDFAGNDPYNMKTRSGGTYDVLQDRALDDSRNKFAGRGMHYSGGTLRASDDILTDYGAQKASSWAEYMATKDQSDAGLTSSFRELEAERLRQERLARERIAAEEAEGIYG